VPSLFDRIFRSRVTSGFAPGTFDLNRARDELAVTTRKLTEVRSEIGSALGISADDLARFLAEIPDILNIGTLSYLHRSKVLADALGLSVAEYLSAQMLIGDPFAVPAGSPSDFYPSEATLRFVAAVDFIRGAGFSIADLDDLLQHRLPAGVVRSPERDAVDRLLLELFDELGRITDEPARRSHIIAKASERFALDAICVALDERPNIALARRHCRGSLWRALR
jgi:hypothetical protein